VIPPPDSSSLSSAEKDALIATLLVRIDEYARVERSANHIGRQHVGFPAAIAIREHGKTAPGKKSLGWKSPQVKRAPHVRECGWSAGGGRAGDPQSAGRKR
jgi:hypothetical protein